MQSVQEFLSIRRSQVHPSKMADELASPAINTESTRHDVTRAQVFALLAIADALQNISVSIDDLHKSFISVEIVAVPEGMTR